MFFEKGAVITELWAIKGECASGRPVYVSGRPFHSLSLRLCGEVVFDIDGKKYVSRGNGITFMPAGVGYTTQVQSKSTILVVHFQTKNSHLDSRPVFIEDGTDIKSAFIQLCDRYRLDGENDYQCMSLFYGILDALSKPQKNVPRRIRHAKSFMDINYSDNVNIAELAVQAQLSEVHFRNEFKKYYGTSPLAYLKQVRIDNAKQLLRSGYYTVTDVALACGFESISYFSYEFKRMTGVSPTEYMQNTDISDW